jgi:hypothetical protein
MVFDVWLIKLDWVDWVGGVAPDRGRLKSRFLVSVPFANFFAASAVNLTTEFTKKMHKESQSFIIQNIILF